MSTSSTSSTQEHVKSVEKSIQSIQGLSTDGLMDTILQSTITNSLMNTLSNDFKITPKNIGVILLVYSLKDIKLIILKIIDKTKEFIIAASVYMYDKAMTNYELYHNHFYNTASSTVEDMELVKYEPKFETTLKLDVSKNTNVIDAIIVYCKDHTDHCMIDDEIKSIEITNLNDYNNLVQINTLIIKHNNIDICMINDISIVLNKYNTIYNIKNVVHDNIDESTFTKVIINSHRLKNIPQYLDFINDFRSRRYNGSSIEFDGSKTYPFAGGNKDKIFDNAVNFRYLGASYMGKLAITHAVDIPTNLICWLIYINYYCNGKSYFKGNKLYFNKLNIYMHFEAEVPDMMMDTVEKQLDKYINGFASAKLIIQAHIDPIKNKLCTNISSSNFKTLKFKISTKTQSTPKDLQNHFHDVLYNKIIPYYKMKMKPADCKIKVFGLKIDELSETKTIENPEYKKYISRKKQFDDIIKNGNENIKTDNLFESMKLSDIPDETIEKIIKSHKLKCDEITTASKHLDTLYLRKEDKDSLKCMLDNFMNPDNLYEELGIRKKLAFMLHGEPGTGKSTTIVAIATYLQRDIYYVNLNTIKTNSQLKEVFDYVLKNCATKGIIVIEEIEKQTPIVLKEQSFDDLEMSVTGSYTNSETTDSLKLPMLLNMLDGTICQENCVFIMTTNHVDKIEPALFRSGRMDVNIEFKKCDHYQVQCIYKRIMGRTLDHEIISQIEENMYTPADIIFHIIKYRHTTCSSEDTSKLHVMDKQIMAKFIKK